MSRKFQMRSIAPTQQLTRFGAVLICLGLGTPLIVIIGTVIWLAT